MEIQVLVATMNQEKNDYSLLERMNLQTNAIISNQCGRNEFVSFKWKGNSIRWLSFAEKGVGLNRNNALMRASGDIVLFADDDMVYVENYSSIVEDAFRQLHDADVILFNLIERNPCRYIIPKKKRVGRFNYLRYGTARIAVRLSKAKINGIYFNQCFGGGTEFSHGEDNLFLTACLDKGMKIYAYPAYIAELTEERSSSWNNGYDEKFLKDQGVLYKQISRKYWKILCLQDAIRHHRKYGISWYKTFGKMIKVAEKI